VPRMKSPPPFCQPRARVTFHWGKHTPPAVLSWILQPSKLATPSTRTPPPCEPREQGQAPSIGAMEDMPGKVQNASTHMLRRQSYEHAHNSRSVKVPVQGGHGTLHRFDLARELTPLCHNTPRTVSITSGASIQIPMPCHVRHSRTRLS
jgi:hypothetical protein